MIYPAASFYARWRANHGFTASLREIAGAPSERLLQAIWQHQRICRDRLRTLDVETVCVLHPGFGSVEGGPDFRDALIQFGNSAPISGDIEVDIRSNGWRSHGHDANPAFRNVVLHVIWEGKPVAAQPKTLCIQNLIDAPISELGFELEHSSVRMLPEKFHGKCAAPLRDLPEERLKELLQDAANVRLQSRAAQFRARARHGGWEQALWEGLFRALGYKHNVWPMQRLGETRATWMRDNFSLLKIQSRLLGISGLLPAELNRNASGADDSLRRVWDGWWRERDGFSEIILPRNAWRFHGLRPANHPQRRLALAAHWACDKSFIERIERWCSTAILDARLLDSLMKLLQVEQDDFWSWHWTFRSARLKKPQPLLGEKRATDLAVNVILPWLYARAVAGGNEKLQREIDRRYHSWPAAEDNSVLRLARQRLLGRSLAARSGLNTASTQQGLLQIVRDFCDHSNATCDGCSFPELVRNWGNGVSLQEQTRAIPKTSG